MVIVGITPWLMKLKYRRQIRMLILVNSNNMSWMTNRQTGNKRAGISRIRSSSERKFKSSMKFKNIEN